MSSKLKQVVERMVEAKGCKSVNLYKWLLSITGTNSRTRLVQLTSFINLLVKWTLTKELSYNKQDQSLQIFILKLQLNYLVEISLSTELNLVSVSHVPIVSKFSLFFLFLIFILSLFSSFPTVPGHGDDARITWVSGGEKSWTLLSGGEFSCLRFLYKPSGGATGEDKKLN